MTKIEIDREDKTIVVDEEMTPSELEDFLLKQAVKEEWVSVSFDDDKDPQVVVRDQQVPLNKSEE